METAANTRTQAGQAKCKWKKEKKLKTHICEPREVFQKREEKSYLQLKIVWCDVRC